MADTGGELKIRLGFEVSPEDLERIRKLLEDVFGKPIPVGPPEGPIGGGPGGSDDADNQKTGRQAGESARELLDSVKKYLKDGENQKKLLSKGINQAEKAISSSMTKGFAIVEDIYSRMKASSPLLQAIESLFNLAMTLFFMPLGNKLGEILIPATVDLLDKVVDMWNAFEGKSLGEMFAYAIDYGVKLFGEYFANIGGLLKEQGGLVGNIGILLQTVGDFIQGPGVGVLNTILVAATTILAHLKEFISLWVAMKAAEITIQSMGVLGDFGAKQVAGVAALAALTAGAASYGTLTGLGMEKGGYVPARPGGSLKVLAEAGKGEYVIPEDQMGSMSGGGMTLNFYGYNEDSLVQKVHDVVNQEISQSRLRSGF